MAATWPSVTSSRSLSSNEAGNASSGSAASDDDVAVVHHVIAGVGARHEAHRLDTLVFPSAF